MNPLLQYFDVKWYLQTRGIPFKEAGRNVQKGWIGIQCPFCDDHSTHLGISLESRGINCWRCTAKGSVLKLVMKLEHCSMEKAVALMLNFAHIDSSVDVRSLGLLSLPKRAELSNVADLYKEAQDKLLPIHQQFLESRNLDAEYIFKKYKLKSVDHKGKYKFRLIIPFYENRQVVTFTTRDVTNRTNDRYIHCPEALSIIPPKQTLYNVENAKDTALVVEGPTDVWRIGDGAVATSGDKWTLKQALMLTKFHRVFILFDPEPVAQENAEALACKIAYSMKGKEVQVLSLDSGDPGSMAEDDVRSLRREIFGR
jgi:DNA primase